LLIMLHVVEQVGATGPDVEPDADGPTEAELAALVAEEPLIEAGLALTAVEIEILTSPHGLSELDWRRWRAAVRRVSHEALAFYNAGGRDRPVLPAVA
jgi:hypothetical protein